MVDYEKITLTLGQLKEYFSIWHENNFKSRHNNDDMKNIIKTYLQENTDIDDIDDIVQDLIILMRIMSKSIDGDSEIPESTTLSQAIADTSNSANHTNFSNANLKSLALQINNLETLISQKVNEDDIEILRQNLNNITGVVPKEIQVQDVTLSELSKDLNDYTTPGLYRSKTTSTTNTLSNKPQAEFTSPFTLAVIPHMENSVKQILITANENTQEDNRMYMRNYNYTTNKWSEWYELYGTHNTQTLQMKVEWSAGGDTTYTLLTKK